MTEYQVARVNLSLPCSVPVVPDTPRTDAPMEQRTEKCHVDAWWFVGPLPICDLHFREFCEMTGDSYSDVVESISRTWPGPIPYDAERKPWSEMHRYEQESAAGVSAS